MSAALSSNFFYRRSQFTYEQHDWSDGLKQVGTVREFPAAMSDGSGYCPDRRMTEICPELLDFELPVRTTEERERVLRMFTSRHPHPLSFLTKLDLVNADHIISGTTASAAAPRFLQERTLPSLVEVWNVVEDMANGKTPGFPGIYLSRDKKLLAQRYFQDYYFAVCSRLFLRTFFDLDTITPIQAHQLYLTDAYTFSLKNELKKTEKDARGIMQASVVAEGVTRLLHTRFSTAQKLEWGDGYSMIGQDFENSSFTRLRSGLPEKVVTDDVPKFDTTVREHEDLLNAGVVAKAYGVGQNSDMLYDDVSAHALALIVNDDGKVYQRLTRDQRMTGYFMTAIYNTMTRARRAVAVFIQAMIEGKVSPGDYGIKAAGDDCLEPYQDDLESRYEALGFTIRDVSVMDTDFMLEFCSHVYMDGKKPFGLRIFKAMGNVIVNKFAPDQLEAFILEFHQNPDFERAMTALKLDPRVVKFLEHKRMVKAGKRRVPRTPVSKARKKKTTTVVVSRNPAPRPAVPMSLVTQACSITNPFCDSAKGARWPDNSWTKSVGQAFEGRRTITSDANGAASTLFVSQTAPAYAIGVVTGTSAAFTNTTAPFGSPSGVVRFRVTSWGLKVRSQLSRFTAAGMMRIRLYSPSTGATLNTVDVTSIYADKFIDVPLARLIEKDVLVVPAPLGSEARLFRDPAEYPAVVNPISTDFKNCGWQVAQVSVTGAPASVDCLEVEIYANYEYVYDDTSTTQLLAQPPPRDNMAAQNASASIFERIGGIAETTTTAIDRIAQSTAFKYLATGVASFFGGPETGLTTYQAIGAGQSARRAITVD